MKLGARVELRTGMPGLDGTGKKSRWLGWRPNPMIEYGD